jgi:hypothetical protein
MSIAFLGFQFAFEAFEAANMKVKDNQRLKQQESVTKPNRKQHDEEPDDEEAEDKEPKMRNRKRKKTDQDKEAKQQEQEVVDVNESTKRKQTR